MGHVLCVPIVRLELTVVADHGNDGDCVNSSSGIGMIDVLKILVGIGITNTNWHDMEQGVGFLSLLVASRILLH